MTSIDDVTQQRRDRAYALAVYEIPKLRWIGLGLLSIAIYFHNRFLLHELSIERWALLTGMFIVYAAASTLLTRLFYTRGVDLSLAYKELPPE